jgi:hypothetical protein
VAAPWARYRRSVIRAPQPGLPLAREGAAVKIDHADGLPHGFSPSVGPPRSRAHVTPVDVACLKVEAEHPRQPGGGAQRGAAHAKALSGPARPSRRRSAAAGTFDADAVLARLVEWSQAHGGAPREYDWDPPLARAMGLATGGCERWERDHPHWPGHATVVRYFGSWAHALHAAGLALRPLCQARVRR